jgi:hypothetical protein
MDWRLVPVDGINSNVYLGDTIKYLYHVLDEDSLPFTGEITGARWELMKIIANVPTPLSPPIYKTMAVGTILLLEGAILQVIVLPTDTDNLAEGDYVAAIKVASDVFGERTYVRRIRLAVKFLEDAI